MAVTRRVCVPEACSAGIGRRRILQRSTQSASQPAFRPSYMRYVVPTKPEQMHRALLASRYALHKLRR